MATLLWPPRPPWPLWPLTKGGWGWLQVCYTSSINIGSIADIVGSGCMSKVISLFPILHFTTPDIKLQPPWSSQADYIWLGHISRHSMSPVILLIPQKAITSHPAVRFPGRPPPSCAKHEDASTVVVEVLKTQRKRYREFEDHISYC